MTARPSPLRRLHRALASGDWLTPARARAYPAIFLVLWLVLGVAWITTGDGVFDRTGKVIGTDFLNVWAAADMALEGRAAEAYDWAAHARAEQRVVGADHPDYYGWHYPPLFLLAVLPLGLLPYLWALAVYLAATAPAYATVLRAILPGRAALLAAAAFPGVWVNIGHGQNGFLTTGLLGGGLLLLDRRPLLAGTLLGLLAYKPQFGLLIPIALAAGGHWRAFSAATAAVIAASGLSAAVFGLDTWSAFFASLELTRTHVIEQGATGWAKIQTAFSTVRLLGGGIGAAYAAQAIATVAAAAAVVAVWRSRAPARLRAAALVAAIPLTSPYLMDYDLVILALPIALLAAEGRETGFLAWEKTVLAAAWLLPLLSRPLATMVPLQLAPMVVAMLLAVIVRRALRPA
ncbi:MAG: glycosyltransferase family 87 protein [Pseudomonadota bacterium]